MTPPQRLPSPRHVNDLFAEASIWPQDASSFLQEYQAHAIEIWCSAINQFGSNNICSMGQRGNAWVFPIPCCFKATLCLRRYQHLQGHVHRPRCCGIDNLTNKTCDLCIKFPSQSPKCELTAVARSGIPNVLCDGTSLPLGHMLAKISKHQTRKQGSSPYGGTPFLSF